MDGWVRFYRQIRDHWLWAEKPFSPGQAFMDMVLCARWRDREQTFMGRRFSLKRAQLLTTHRQLGRDWGWDHKRVGRFLQLLIDCSMILKQDFKACPEHDQPVTAKRPTNAPPNAPACIVITICNFERYQSGEDDAPQVSPHQSPTDAPASPQPRPTTEERKKERREEEGDPWPSGTSLESEKKESDCILRLVQDAISGSSANEETVRQLFQKAKQIKCPNKDDVIRKHVEALCVRRDVGPERLQKYLWSEDAVGRDVIEWGEHFRRISKNGSAATAQKYPEPRKLYDE